MFASVVGRVAQILRRRWLLLSIFAGLFATYTLAGFFLVPYLARAGVTDYVENTLHRRVSIGALSFNPFTLTAEIRSFALTEADNSPIASFDLLRVNAEFRSLVYRAWTFKEVRIDRPNIRVLVNADGSLNLAKLAPPATEPSSPAAVPALRIGSFAVHGGRVAFDDMSRGRPFSETLTPIEFTLNDFRTAPDYQNRYSFEGSTEAGERLTWSGQFTVQPLGSTGQFTVTALKAPTLVSYLQDAIPFNLPSGTIDVAGTYRLTIADQMGMTVTLPKVSLRDFAMAPKGDGAPTYVGLPQLDVINASFSLAERKLAAERIDIANVKLTVWREADGTLNLQQLMPAPAAAASAATPALTPVSAPPPPFSISVATLAIRDAAIDVEDRTTRPAAKFNLAPVALTVSGYSSDPNNTVKLDMSAGIDGKGRIAAQGDLKLSPLTANLDIDAADIELPPIQPYLAQMTGMQLMSGQLSLKNKIAYAAEPARGQPGLHLTGDITVANLATQDTALHQDFIKWKQLRLSGLDYAQGPDRLSIERVDAVEPYGRVIISSDATLNVVAILNPPAAAQAGVRAPAPAAAPKAPAKPAAAMPMRIGTVTIENGSTNFSDFSIQPNFSAGILALTGTVSGLSSAPNSRAQVKLAGNVDRFSPVDITGEVNVLSAAMYTDLALNFHNMELTIFNPYSGKYAGYNITKGKLSTELKYKVDNRKLDAQHHVVLDQLEFGAATNSKDAVPLPIRLAVALLKDRNGVIDLNVPVGGSLDDPMFKVGPIIWQAFVNVLGKIVTAPFALLGSLFGGGEELAYIDFSAGSADLTPDQIDKLTKVANALAGRPELKLDIPLETLNAADDAVLKNAAFEAAVTTAMAGAPAGPEQRLAALEKLFQEQTGAAPMYPVGAAPAEGDSTNEHVAYLEQALRDRFMPTKEQRDSLAKARADAVQNAVLGNKDIMPERVFLVGRPSGKTDAARMVRMELSLQ